VPSNSRHPSLCCVDLKPALFKSRLSFEQAELRERRSSSWPHVSSTSVMTLVGYNEPEPTFLGAAVLMAAAVFMAVLAKEKRRLSLETGSAALRADASSPLRVSFFNRLGRFSRERNMDYKLG
jgi:hypothetical protein